MIKDINEENFAYDRFVTNDNLMCESYIVMDEGFYRDHKAKYCGLKLKLKNPYIKLISFNVNVFLNNSFISLNSLIEYHYIIN